MIYEFPIGFIDGGSMNGRILVFTKVFNANFYAWIIWFFGPGIICSNE